MPTYHARNVKISLATSSLADSTIAEPGRRRDKTGPVASEQYEVIVQTSKILKENFIPCPDGHRNLWLLGRDENIPFYLVRVGDEVFKQSDGPDAEKRSMRLRSSGNTSLLGPGSHITSSLSYGSDSEQSMADSLNIARLGASIGPRRRPGLQLSLGNLARHNQDNIQQEIPILSPLPSPILSAVSVDPDAIPRALSLKIELSRNAFLTNLRGNDVEDIRYDVFYNGELADSNYVPHASARVGDTGSVVRFISGKRVHMFVERPWIITRPGQDAKGELRLKNTAKRSTAQDRWDLIREALRREAQQLEVSASGIKSPVAEFLMSLAAVDLPAEVESRYKSGTPKFGVIDVVLSTGTGVKKSLNAPFLVRPSTLSPVKYSNGLSPGLDMHISNPDLQASPAATRARTMQKRKKQEHCDSSLKNSIQAMDLDVNIAIDSNSGMNTTSESKRSITNGRGQPQLEVTPSRTGHSAGVTDLNTALDPGSSQPGVRKRRISMPPPPVPTGGSLKSARRHLAAPAVDGGPPKRRRTTSGDQSKLSSGRKTVEGFFRVEGGEQSPPLKLKSLVIKLRVSPVAADRFSQNRRSTAVSQSSETSNRDVTMQDKAGELLKSSPASKGSEGLYNETTSKADNQITTQLSSNLAFESSSSSKRAARSRSRNTYQTAPSSGPVKRHQLGSGTWEYEQFTFAQLLDTDWETPELSKDCVATYAEDGPWLKDASGSGFLRQVKSVKGGSFKETQVLLGVRFVVI